ncbi:hypothetical protein EYC84_000483 [Monilinia fructicola]|uniref:UBA domain-containing protein n=1 Tax=Monilinia fructicola TaxID=38448 RepID=A0A5M9JNQ1_MONFR|nr:hypothetical protein EYC84_000483 [Monilinia fructicola]
MLHVRTNEARNVNARVEESISDSFIIVRKIHQLPPWKFINLELKFGASNDVPAVDKDLMRILKEFARDLEISERCSVSVSTARFIPAGSSHIRGAVDLISIGLGSRAVKLHLHQSPTSAEPYTFPHGLEGKIQSSTSFDVQPSLMDPNKDFCKKTTSSSYSNKTASALTTNPNDIPQESTEEGGVPFYPQSSPPKEVEKWIEQVQVDRRDNELAEKLYRYFLHSDNSGSIFEWPWVQTELHKVQSFRQKPCLEACPDSDKEESTSPISESAPTRLRGGCAGWKFMHKSGERSSIKNSQCRDCRNDIDLGYGGSHLFAKPFPEYDPTVDLMYLYDTDQEKIQERLHGILSMDMRLIKEAKSALRNEIRRARSNSSNPEFDLQPGSDSTYTYLRGGMIRPTEYSSIDSPSSGCMRRRDKLLHMVEKFMKYTKFTRGKLQDKVKTPNKGNGESIENFENTEDDMTEDGEWPGKLPLRNDETLTDLNRAIDYYNQNGRKAYALQEKLDRIKTRLANAGIINEEYDDYFQDTQELDIYEQMVYDVLSRNQVGELYDTLVFRCGAAAIGAAQILKRRIQQAQLDESKSPAVRQRGRHRESKSEKLIGAENNELEGDNVDEIESMKEEDEWVDNDDDELDGEQLWRHKLGMWREPDIYYSALSIYNHLRKQVYDLKAKLCKIEETIPKNSTVIQEYRGICQDTKKLLSFELTEVDLQRESQKGTLTERERLRRMYIVSKYATHARTVLSKRINLAEAACRYGVKKNERKRNIFHLLKGSFGKCRREKGVVKEQSHPLRSGESSEVKDLSSVVTVEKLLEEYDRLKNQVRHLRLVAGIRIHDDGDLEKNSNFWTILEEQNKVEMLMRDIKYLRDNGRIPSILLASYGVLKAKEVKALIENNFNIAQTAYSRLESLSIHQRGGAGSDSRRNRLRWKLGKLTLFVRKIGRRRRLSERLQGRESHEETGDRGRSAARRVGSSFSCLLTNYDRLSREVEELRRDESSLRGKGAKIDEYTGYWTEMGKIQAHLELRADVQARRDQNAVLLVPQIERGVSKAQCAKEILELRNQILRDDLSASNEESRWSSGSSRAGGLERKHDLLLSNFMQATQFLGDAFALKFPIAEEIYASTKDISDSLVEISDVILTPQSESRNTQLRGGVGRDWKEFCLNQLAKIRKQYSRSERFSGGLQRGEHDEPLLAPSSNPRPTEPLQTQRQAHQQHSRGDSGVSGVGVTPSQPKDESVQKDPPQQANIFSQFSHRLQPSRGGADPGVHAAPVENPSAIAPADPDDPGEIEERRQKERNMIAMRQIERKQELSSISNDFVLIMGEFINLTEMIRNNRRRLFYKRIVTNYLIAARRTNEIMENWLRDIKQQDFPREKRLYLREIGYATRILDEWPGYMNGMVHYSFTTQRGKDSRASALGPVQHRRGEERGESSRSSVPNSVQNLHGEKNGASSKSSILDRGRRYWGKERRELSRSSVFNKARYHQNEESDSSSESSTPNPVRPDQDKRSGESLRISIPDTARYHQTEESDASSESSIPNPVQSLQAERNAPSSKSSIPHPVRQYQGEERGESSTSSVHNPVDEILKQTTQLRIKNDLPLTVPTRKESQRKVTRKERLSSSTSGPLFMCYEEDAIPEEVMNRFLKMGHMREEIVFAFSASAGDAQEAARILSPEAFDESQIPTEVIDQLQGLGTSRDEVFNALRSSNGNVNLAAEILFAEEIDLFDQPFTLADVHYLANSLQAPAAQAFEALVATGGDQTEAASRIFSGEIPAARLVSLESMHRLVRLGATGRQAYDFLQTARGDIQRATGLFLEVERSGQPSFPTEQIDYFVAFGVSRVAAGNALAIAGGDTQHATEILLPLITQESSQDCNNSDDDEGGDDDGETVVTESEAAEEDIDRLVELGISSSEAFDVLLDFENDVGAATEYLISRSLREEATEDGEAKNDKAENDEMTNERNIPGNHNIDRKGKGKASEIDTM